MSQAIQEALGKLDPTNDNHWTQDGLPRLDTVKILTGNPSLSREDLNSAAPGFTRQQAGPQATADAGVGGTTGEPAVAAPVAPQPPAPPAPPVDEAPQLNPVVVEQDEMANLKDELETLQLNYNETVVIEGRVKTRLYELQNAMDAVNDRIVHLQKGSQDNPVMNYLARQRKDLELRGQRMQAIQESGLRLGELAASLRSPIDSSFKNRRRRG